MTFDLACAISTETAGAAGAGAMENFDLYARIRCTRNIDGASIPNCTRWKYVRACHTSSKLQSSNLLEIDLARDSSLSKPLRHLFSSRVKCRRGCQSSALLHSLAGIKVASLTGNQDLHAAVYCGVRAHSVAYRGGKVVSSKLSR